MFSGIHRPRWTDQILFLISMSRVLSILTGRTMVYNTLKPSKLTVDIGCGNGAKVEQLLSFDFARKLRDGTFVGTDLHEPSLGLAKQIYHHVVLADARHLPLRQGVFELVLCIQVIEHLRQADGKKLLDEIDRLDPRQALLTVPMGYDPKTVLEDANPHQSHESAWYPAEFLHRGYLVYGMGGLRQIRGERSQFRLNNTMLYPLFQLLSMATQLFSYRFVTIAYQMICTKEYPSKSPDEYLARRSGSSFP